MKQIFLVFIGILIITSILSCKKNKIKTEYLTENIWKLYQVDFVDANENITNFNYTYLGEECKKNNTHRYYSNNLYTNFNECSIEDQLFDSLNWYFNEGKTEIYTYLIEDTSHYFSIYHYQINELNETNLKLQTIPQFGEEHYYIYYYQVK